MPAADPTCRASNGLGDVCGDWLLTFQAGEGALPTRTPSFRWRTLHRAKGGRLLGTAPEAGWVGAPWHYQRRDGRHLWLHGELYPLAGGAVDPMAVALGEEGAARLNGHFLLLAHEEESGRWRLWSDRFGTLHAYLARRGDAVAVGSYFPAVAAAASARRLDWPALAGFFSCGYFPGARTFFDDVQILRPSTCTTLAADGRLLGAQRYWHWRHAPDTRRGYDETVEALCGKLGLVVTDLTGGGRVAVPLSGGLDSRSTAAAVPREAWESGRLWAFSYGYGTASVETRIARRLAAVRALPFDAFRIRPYLFAETDLTLAAIEGFQDLTQTRQLAVREEIGAHAERLLAAHWGDVWLDDLGLAGRTGIGEEALVDHALGRVRKRGGQWLLDHLCRPQLAGEEPERVLRDQVAAELARFADLADPDFRLKAWKTEGWSARWTTASLRAYQTAAFPRLPFYDTRLTDFLATVPSPFLAGRRLQIDALKRRAPDLAQVPCQAYDADLYHHDRAVVRRLARRAARKVWRLATGRRVVERNWEVQLGGEAGRRGLEEWLLRPELTLHELVPRTEIQALVDRFLTTPPDGALGYTVSMLLTFSLWLERHG